MTACLLGKSSGRWRRGGCCFSTMKGLFSSPALKPLVPTLCLAAVVVYGLADKLRNFVAGIFIPQYHFPFPVALCFAQVLVSLLVLNLLHAVGLVPLKPYSRSLGERLLVPASCGSLHSVLALWAKANCSPFGLYPLSLPLLPMVTLGFSCCLRLGSSSTSTHMAVLVSMLSGASFVLTASKGLAGVEPLEYLYAPLALILHALSLTWLAKVSEAERQHPPDAQASIFDIYYAQVVNQCWVLAPLWLLHPHNPWQVLRGGSWHSLLFLGYLLAILLLGTALDFMAGVSAMCASPLAATVLHSARQVVQPFMQLL